MTVPLWTAWHYELGTMQDQLMGGSGIFLLKRDGAPVYPADFQRPLTERDEIQRILRARNVALEAYMPGDRSLIVVST